MEFITINGIRIQCKIERRKRRSVALMFESETQLRILIPQKLTDRDLKRILTDREPWLSKNQMALQSMAQLRVNQTWQTGDLIYYKGMPHSLQCITKADPVYPTVKVCERKMIVELSDPNDADAVRKAVESFYREAARRFVIELVPSYECALGVKVNRITIKSQRKRWGSCSSRGNINFNWKCAMLPDAAFAYIVIHELAHLVHLNHSKAFWQLVEQMCPDYKAIQKWISQHQLAFE